MQTKNILLTGGSGKFGKALLKALPALGYKVFFTSRSKEKVVELEQQFNHDTPTHLHIKGIAVDLTSPEYIKQIDNYFQTENEYPQVLINNARSIDTLKVNNGVTSSENFIKELSLGVVVPYELSMFFAEKGLQNIINIASMYGVVPPNKNLYLDGYNQSPVQYGVAKAALIHLTKELAVRFSDKKIRVNAISYGGVSGRVDDDFKLRYANLTPMGRMLEENEISGPVEFLLSEKSIGMTGHNLLFEGGYTIW
jgi:NAD(P)-dependent dehydrogenase (short-subunit alcohol dehydrogenase family)